MRITLSTDDVIDGAVLGVGEPEDATLSTFFRLRKMSSAMVRFVTQSPKPACSRKRTRCSRSWRRRNCPPY
jgi:hypothetical protein